MSETHLNTLINRCIAKTLSDIENNQQPNYPEIIKKRLRFLEIDILKISKPSK